MTPGNRAMTRVSFVVPTTFKGQWYDEVMSVAQRQPMAFTTPVAVHVSFGYPRPKAHYGTGRNHARLRPSAPRHHTGDLREPLEAVGWALVMARLITDHALIIELNARQAWTVRGGVHIRLNDLMDPL